MEDNNNKYLKNIDLDKFLDVIGGIVIVLDRNGVVRMINNKGAEMLGLEKENILSKNWFDIFVPSKQRKEVRMVFNKIMQNQIENTEYHENSILNNQGDEIIISWHNAILKNNDEIIGTISSGDDITSRKKFEKDLERKNIKLKSMNDLMINRELKMIELKKKIKKLEQ